MSNETKEISHPIVSNVIPVFSKITDHKLTGPNFLDWSKTVRLYLRSIKKAHHLTDKPHEDDDDWLENDARLFLQIRNSIDSDIVTLVNHCEYVNELMEYLQFLYSGKDNISRIYDVCKKFYRADREGQPLQSYFMNFKKTFEELNNFMPFSTDVTVQRTQREQLAVMSFLAGIGTEYDVVTSQILSSAEIPSLNEAFSRILRSEVTSFTPSAVTESSALISRNTRIDHLSKGPHRGENRDKKGSETDEGRIVCYYCHEPGHTKRTCKKLQNKNRHTRFAHVAARDPPQSSDSTYTLSAE